MDDIENLTVQQLRIRWAESLIALVELEDSLVRVHRARETPGQWRPYSTVEEAVIRIIELEEEIRVIERELDRRTC